MVNVNENKNGGTSKARREQIKGGIEQVKSTLPLSKADSENLSQLQTLHCSCTYIRKMESFKQLNLNRPESDFFIYPQLQHLVNQYAFSETLFGFVIVLSRDRHLLYVSENVVDYLGLRAIEVLLSCETFEDILHPNDENQLLDVFKQPGQYNKEHEFYCSWNASKIKRRVHTKADAKVIKINGRFIANGNLFVATCTPMLRSVNREYLVATSPTCFTSVHSLDLKFLEICEKAQNILGYSNNQIEKSGLYDILHVKDLDLIRRRHKNLLNTKSQKGKIDTIQVLKRDGTYVNCLVNIYYCVNSFIICKYQVLSENEVINYNQYMDSLTDHLPQHDGADGSDAADGSDEYDNQYQSGPSSINSSTNEDSDYDQYQSPHIISQSRKRKSEESDESSSCDSFENNNAAKVKRISTDSNVSIKDEVIFTPQVSVNTKIEPVFYPYENNIQFIQHPYQIAHFQPMQYVNYQTTPSFVFDNNQHASVAILNTNNNLYTNEVNMNLPVFQQQQINDAFSYQEQFNNSINANQCSPCSSLDSDIEKSDLTDLKFDPGFLNFINEDDINNVAQDNILFNKECEYNFNNNSDLDDILAIIQNETTLSAVAIPYQQ